MAPETPRGVSSKLLTMKFMQRAAASASSTSPGSDGSSAKKRKLDSPSGRIRGDVDQASIQAALDDQEATRRAALARHAAADTHWVLNNPLDASRTKTTVTAPLNVVYVGYGDFDSADEVDEDAPQQGRTSTRTKPKSSVKGSSSQDQRDADGTSDESSDDANDTAGSRKRKHSEGDHSSHASDSRSRSRSQSRKRDPENEKAKEFRDKRRKKEVRLNKITSISSGGGNSAGAKPKASGKSMTCYNCQEPGHMAADCPNRRSRGAGKNR